MSRLAVPALIAACLAQPVHASPGTGSGAPKMLMHGNYCGPGNNAPLAPVDALDQACARHDACTPTGALPSKACNLRLQADAERVAQDPRQPSDLRSMAGLVATGAALMPFDPAQRSLAPVAARPVENAPVVQRPDLDEDVVTDDGEIDPE
ncbi:hypothetical protein ACQKJ1_26855 [Methylorubrum rhodesianum]|uniref:hypothetical protein n=1 Tax=Methylorubrum rhodesianum TaxID=29427 RepID=UPI003D0586E3